MVELHRNMRTQSDAENENWVEPREYFELALSTRKLWRCDQPGQGVLGLVDPETGQRYLIRRESLHDESV